MSARQRELPGPSRPPKPPADLALFVYPFSMRGGTPRVLFGHPPIPVAENRPGPHKKRALRNHPPPTSGCGGRRHAREPAAPMGIEANVTFVSNIRCFCPEWASVPRARVGCRNPPVSLAPLLHSGQRVQLADLQVTTRPVEDDHRGGDWNELRSDAPSDELGGPVGGAPRGHAGRGHGRVFGADRIHRHRRVPGAHRRWLGTGSQFRLRPRPFALSDSLTDSKTL